MPPIMPRSAIAWARKATTTSVLRPPSRPASIGTTITVVIATALIRTFSVVGKTALNGSGVPEKAAKATSATTPAKAARGPPSPM